VPRGERRTDLRILTTTNEEPTLQLPKFTVGKARIPRFLIWQFVIVFGPVFAFYSCYLAMLLFGWPDIKWLMQYGTAAPFVPVAASHVWLFGGLLLCRLYKRGLRRRLVAAEGRLCTNCCYDLSAHDEKGICPECSTAYSVGELRQDWRKYRLLKDTPPVL